jgi:hypothetical protein
METRMSNRFIKFIPSQESDFLQENHPNAFLLLCLIAKRARRISGHPDGLEIGEAQIGDYKKAGIETRDKYRTALEILVKRSHIRICETCRTRKKSSPHQNVEKIFEIKNSPTETTNGYPTGSTTIGTKVKLLRSDVWDINSEQITEKNPHQNSQLDPHRTPTGSPPDPHEQERTRKNKKEKETTTPNPHSSSESVGSVRSVGFFSCLDGLDLTDEEKKKLCQFEESRVQAAVNYVKDPSFKAKKTLMHALMWHCNLSNAPMNSEEKNKISIKNSNLAVKLYNQCKQKIKGNIYQWKDKCLVLGDNKSQESISVYEKPQIFLSLLESSLRKYDMWVPDMSSKVVNLEEIEDYRTYK